MARPRQNPVPFLLAGVLAGCVGMTLFLTRKMTFFQDVFAFLIDRREITLDTVMRPHNEHIAVFPVLIEQGILRVFGMGTARPEYVLLALFLAATAFLLFVYVRRKLGDWPALFATILIVCLGPAWEVLLWPFEIGFAGSIGFGIAMFLALEREDRKGDVAACLFLVLSMGFSSLGIPFAVGAAVEVLQKRRSRGLGRAWVVGIPLFLFALWYLGWGSEAESHLSLRNVLLSPRFVVESIAVSAGSLVGLGTSPINGSTDPSWGRIILVPLVAVVAYRLLRRPGFSSTLWPVAAAALANWFLTAFNLMPGRDPTSSRYQYAGGILIILLLANLLSNQRFSRRALIVAGVVTALAIGPNLVVLKDGKENLEAQSVLTRADLGALEIARRTVAPEFQLGPEVAGTPSLINVFAGEWLQAVDEYGSPAYTPAELETAPPHGRRQADIVLGQALPLATYIRRDAFAAGGRENCVLASPNGPDEIRIGFGPTTIEVAPGADAGVSLRRFAQPGEFPVATSGAPGGSTTVLRVPRDLAPQPWYLHVEATQEVRVCR